MALDTGFIPTPKCIQKIQQNLGAWFLRNKRDLPWRHSGNPYHILVSEFMLQQTQVKTVLPYYKRWIKSFPSIEKLAAAKESTILKNWEGLGYYSRARNLHKSAKTLVKEYGGIIPDTLDEILKLPGVGRYTAGAVLSIAFDKKLPILDGNVKRVLSRLFCLDENGSTSASEKRLWNFAEKMVPAANPGDFNQALMELGATICLPRNPLCLLCPIQSNCLALKDGVQANFPPAKPRMETKKIEVSAGVLWRNGKTYIQQRPKNGLMGGLWEFPGGKIDKNESPEACLKREINEELGLDITISEKIMVIKHSYTLFRVTLHVFRCRPHLGRVRPSCCSQWKWVAPGELKNYPFPAANVKIIKYISRNGMSEKKFP